MPVRENPLDIDYSLRIGTSLYHVLGKRRKSRRSKYDYYVVDDKLIRSTSKRRPRYIVDESRPKANRPRVRPPSPPPPAPSPLKIEEIKQTLIETIENEREKIVASLRETLAEEKEAATQGNKRKDKQSADLIRRTIQETLSTHNNQSSTVFQQLEDRIVRTIERELEKARSEAETTQNEKEAAKKDEQDKLVRLFDEQKQVLSDVLKQQQATAESADSIKKAVTDALHEQQPSVSKEDIQQLENKLGEEIQKIVKMYHSIKIINDLDGVAKSLDDLAELHNEQEESENDNDTH